MIEPDIPVGTGIHDDAITFMYIRRQLEYEVELLPHLGEFALALWRASDKKISHSGLH